jgi:hypothetical protein
VPEPRVRLHRLATASLLAINRQEVFDGCAEVVVEGAGSVGRVRRGYELWLEGRGICRRAVRDRLWQLWYLSEWLDGQNLSVGDLDRHRTAEYLAARQAAGCVDWVAPSSLRMPLEYLRAIGAVPTEAELPAGPVDRLLVDYREYLAACAL